VYGAPIAPYPGYSVLGALGSFFGGALVQFGPGMAMAAFDRFPFGWIGWGLSWLAHGIFFNHSAYFTHSTTVADWGFPHGGQRVFGPRGLGNGYHGPQPYNRMGGAYATARGGAYRGEGSATGNNYGRGSGYTHAEAPGQQAYNRMPMQPVRPQAYAGQENYGRPAYGSPYANRPAENFGSRPAAGYANGSSGYRAPAYPNPSYRAPSYREPTFRQPAYQAQQFRAPEMNSGRGFTGRSQGGYDEFARNERSGGFHGFGGERESKSFREEGFGGGHAPKGFGHEKAPKAPKESHSGGGHGHRR
jgi:hypothetical protein